MAQFDLKNATIYIRDGYQKLGAVNNPAGYSIGATTMLVDGFTSPAVVTGDLFYITGQTTKYKITAHAETLGATTSITFTPGLTSAVVDDQVITVGPHELEVKVGEGNMSFTEKKTREYVKDRGKLSTVRNGDEEPVEVRLDFIWEWLKADTGFTPSIEDVLKQRGEAAAWVSSSTDQCEPYAVDMIIDYVPPCTAEKKEIITLADFRYEELAHDAREGTISTTGKCNITEATVARVAA